MSSDFTIKNRVAETWASKIGNLVQNAAGGRQRLTFPQISGNQTNSSGNTSKSTRLEKLLTLQEESSGYCDEDKYDEAYGLLNKQYKLGAEVSFIPVLVNFYAALIKTDRADETDEVMDNLVTSLRDKLKAHPKECETIADKHRKEAEYVKSLLFYQVAAKLFMERNDAQDVLLGLQGCMLGTKICIKKILKRFPSTHSFLVERILPTMYQMKEKIQNVKGVHKKAVSLTLGICMHHLENSEYFLGNLNAREAVIEESVSLMEKNLGEDAGKCHLYGAALNNLGASYLNNGKPQEAKNLFVKAIEVNMAAEDYDTEEERMGDVRRSESALQQAEEALNFVAQ